MMCGRVARVILVVTVTLSLWICLEGVVVAMGQTAAPGGSENEAAEATLPAYERAVMLETTSETSANVSIGDLDGDGNLDIVLAKGRHWPLVDRVLLGDGRGEFPRAWDLGEASDRTYSGRLADMDGDQDLDVVISNDDPDPKLVYLNDGKGRFRVGSTFGRAEWSTRNASVADVDQDGLLDIVVANRTGDGPGASYLCLNRGEGRFDEECLVFARESATTITPADFDSNGFVDFAVPHRDGGQSHVYLNEQGADLSNLRRIPFGPPDARIRMAIAGDLNGDSHLDLVTIDQRRGVTTHFNLGGVSFSAALPIEGASARPYALAVSDLNLDGTMDLVVGNVESASVAYFNDGSGIKFTAVPFGDGEGTVYGFAIDDLDQDGRLDIAVARSGAPNVVYFASAPAAESR